MASITQDMRYRLSLIKYAERYGVTKAAVKYKTNRQYIYRWKNRYDGSWDSLRDRSRRPHSHPNQHTPEEIKLIRDMRRRNPMPDWLFSGSSSCSAVISVPSPDSTDSLRNRGSWRKNSLTPSMSPNPMNKCHIPDSGYRST